MNLMARLKQSVSKNPKNLEEVITYAVETKQPLNISFYMSEQLKPESQHTTLGTIHPPDQTKTTTYKLNISTYLENGKEPIISTIEPKPITYQDLDSEETKLETRINKLEFLQTIYGIAKDIQASNIDLQIEGKSYELKNIQLFENLPTNANESKTYYSKCITANFDAFDILDCLTTEDRTKNYTLDEVFDALSEMSLEN